MSEETRGSLVGLLWIVTMLGICGIFVSGGIQGSTTAIHFGMATMILLICVISTPFLLRYADGNASAAREKAKRERIDKMLRDMDDAELLELKKRLSDGDYEGDMIYDSVSDDGELILRA